MKELLIIRSASFQQLDKNIIAIKEKYKGYSIDLLTHEHGVKLAEKYKMIDNIYIYPYSGSFKYSNKVTQLKGRKYDVVIIPVTNITGAGFLNVLFYSLTLNTKRRVICNVVSEMKEISIAEIIFMELKNLVFSSLSLFFTFILFLPVILFLPFKLKFLEKSNE